MANLVSASALDHPPALSGLERSAPAGTAAARDARAVLAARGWLATCPPDFAAAVLEASEIVAMPPEATLLQWGEPGRGLCGLASGGFYVNVAGPDGVLHKMHLGAPGLWLGETALLGETARRIQVTTAVPSTVAWLAAERIDVLARTRPDTWRHLGRLAASHTTRAMASVSCLLIRDSVARVAHKLLQLDPGDGPCVSLTQTALGEMVGLSRNTLNRVLATLERAGALHVGYARIQVTDRAKLEHVARFGGGH
jgi:CRP-like cAMP-binding protein